MIESETDFEHHWGRAMTPAGVPILDINWGRKALFRVQAETGERAWVWGDPGCYDDAVEVLGGYLKRLDDDKFTVRDATPEEFARIAEISDRWPGIAANNTQPFVGEEER